MKKIFLVALVALFSTTAMADNKNEKNIQKAAKKIEKALPATVITSSDTLSYLVGVTMTDGLSHYIKQQYGVDSTNIHYFIEGVLDYFKNANDPKVSARKAGEKIAFDLHTQMLKRAHSDFTGTPDTIVDPVLYRAFADAVIGHNLEFTKSQANKQLSDIRIRNMEAKKNMAIQKGVDFLNENEKKPGVIRTASGLQYKIIKEGNGKIPQKTSSVKVHYEGRLIDGTVFDASRKYGDEPIKLDVDKVIRGWTEALMLMPVGSQWEIYIPYKLAYGERQTGSIPPYSALIFNVELIDIVE